MSVVYFNKSGIAVCVAEDTTELTGLNEDLPYAEILPDGYNITQVYYDLGQNKLEFKKNFNIQLVKGGILNVPTGTIVMTKYSHHVVDDGEIFFESNFPGSKISVTLEHPKYLKHSVEVVSV